ncbi:MAG: SufD family Fe-S cluster assembly protein, partial [Pseudomonadota bacterium]
MTELKSLIKDPTAAELELVALYGALPEDTRRERAFKAFAWNGLPHRRMEAFKWTDFRRALPELKDGPGASEDPFAGIEGPWIVFRNGRADGLNDLPEGLRAFRKDEAQAFAAAEDLPLGALTAALVDETILIEVTEQIEKPLRLIFASSGDAEFARIAFVVRRDASLTVMESHLGGAGLNGALLSYGLQAGAKINRTLVQPGGDAAYAVTAEVFLDQDAEFTQTALAFGGHVARVETRLVHQETGSRAEINGAYLAAKGRHIDFTSHIRHGARACETVQRTKGAVLDGGTGVFQGKFHVPK